MFAVITGGSGSGKSEYAENLLLALDGDKIKNRTYIATMYPFDEESHKRIKRHRIMRSGKGFTTVECYTGLKTLELPKDTGQSVLLECMSNLTANECYMEQGVGNDAVEEILLGVDRLHRLTTNLVIVTNEVFSDGVRYDESTEHYREFLGQINCRMAEMADLFVEVVYTIPIIHKGRLDINVTTGGRIS